MKRSYIFSLICFGIFLLNLGFQYLQVSLPVFFTSWLNDLLCLPVVLGICSFCINSYSKNKPVRISLFSALSLAVLYSIYFEVYLPKITERYTADIIDVLLYFTGAVLFYFSQEKQLHYSQLPSKKAA